MPTNAADTGFCRMASCRPLTKSPDCRVVHRAISLAASMSFWTCLIVMSGVSEDGFRRPSPTTISTPPIAAPTTPASNMCRDRRHALLNQEQSERDKEKNECRHDQKRAAEQEGHAYARLAALSASSARARRISVWTSCDSCSKASPSRREIERASVRKSLMTAYIPPVGPTVLGADAVETLEPPDPLFRNRTAAKPSNTAAPKKAVGCLRAKSCTLPTISDMSRLRMAWETFSSWAAALRM